tara:strand:+ start:1451 stop:1669 length:219 start_codon:yes stop_codon:yes gene_type:complete
LPNKNVNPYTDAILTVIGEYKTIKEDSRQPQKRSPKIMHGTKSPTGLKRLSQSMERAGITMPDKKWIIKNDT